MAVASVPVHTPGTAFWDPGASAEGGWPGTAGSGCAWLTPPPPGTSVSGAEQGSFRKPVVGKRAQSGGAGVHGALRPHLEVLAASPQPARGPAPCPPRSSAPVPSAPRAGTGHQAPRWPRHVRGRPAACRAPCVCVPLPDPRPCLAPKDSPGDCHGPAAETLGGVRLGPAVGPTQHRPRGDTAWSGARWGPCRHRARPPCPQRPGRAPATAAGGFGSHRGRTGPVSTAPRPPPPPSGPAARA